MFQLVSLGISCILMCLSFPFRCDIQSVCAHQVSGLMSTAGKKEWSVASVGNEIRTAAKEKINPEELTVIIRPMKGKNL